MPTVLREGPYRFFFYSRDCSEPLHVHVETSDGSCKVWVASLETVQAIGLSNKEINEIVDLVEKHRETIEIKWNEHCRGYSPN